ncbi:MAG: HAD family phosphatase [Chloroflexi bacterium]|nr:HAD family phosphatase [Chloroflexota bacterium]
MDSFDSGDSGGPFRAVCFDLDGVIVDSEPVHYEADRRAMASQGVEFTFEDKKANYIGRTVRDTMFLLSEAHGLPDPEAVLRERERHFEELVATDLELRDGARDLLIRLSDRSIPCALVTSGNRLYVDGVFERFDLASLFTGLVTMEDVSAHKPSPEPYLAGARTLGVAPGSCVAVEDSPSGVASAKAAGMYCIAAPSEMTLDADLSAADVRVESFAEIDSIRLDRLFGAL